jgi:hypothetical protein
MDKKRMTFSSGFTKKLEEPKLFGRKIAQALIKPKVHPFWGSRMSHGVKVRTPPRSIG